MTEGIISNSDYNHYAFIFGSYFEIIFFFFILMNKFYKTNRELSLLQDKNNEILEARIEARTEEISQLLGEKELLLKEIYHRVKNNFQIIISLLWMEASKKDIKLEYKNYFFEIINRIKSMSLIHSYLLESRTLSEIESKEYLIQIINQTKQIYSKNIIITEEIDTCYLNIDQALSLGIIINEILNNAVKYHNNIDKCKISLSFLVNNNNIKLLIKDNGIGYIPDNNSSGFGIKMVIDFAKKLESSKIEFIINDGTEFILDFKILRLKYIKN